MRLAAIVCAVLAAAPARAEGLVNLSDAGLYDVAAIQHVPDTGSVNGSHVVATGHLIERATHICPKLGTAFGVKFTLSTAAGVDALPVTLGIQHPPMTNYAGQSQTEDDFKASLTSGTAFLSFWVFESQAKLKPGRWHFTLSHGGVLLLDQPFDVDVTCQKLVS